MSYDKSIAAEIQLRDLLKIELTKFEHPTLDRFLAQVRGLRMSDLVACVSDRDTVDAWIGEKAIDPTSSRGQCLAAAAILAAKDEIDRRFPIPESSS